MNLLSKFLSKYSREHISVAKILHTLFLTAPESVLLFLLFFSHHKSILYLAPINYLGGYYYYKLATPHFTISTPSSTILMGNICLKSFSSQ